MRRYRRNRGVRFAEPDPDFQKFYNLTQTIYDTIYRYVLFDAERAVKIAEEIARKEPKLVATNDLLKRIYECVKSLKIAKDAALFAKNDAHYIEKPLLNPRHIFPGNH